MTERSSDLGRVTWGDEQGGGSTKRPLPFYARPHDTPSAMPPHLIQTASNTQGFLTRRQFIIVLALSVLLGVCLFTGGFFLGSWYSRQPLSEQPTSKTSVKTSKKSEGEASSRKQRIPVAPKPVYSVELGTLLSRINAEELARYLQKENISAKIITQQRQSAPPIFIVRTQEYPSYIEARTVAEMLISKHLLSATVVKSNGGKTP